MNKFRCYSSCSAALLVASCVGCSSTGFHEKSFVPGNERVAIERPTDLLLEKYRANLVEVLAAHHLTVVTNGTPGALVCRAQFQGGVTMRAHVSLWEGEQMLLCGESYNGGWGTMLAQGSAADHAIKSAIQSFSKELDFAESGKPRPKPVAYAPHSADK